MNAPRVIHQLPEVQRSLQWRRGALIVLLTVPAWMACGGGGGSSPPPPPPTPDFTLALNPATKSVDAGSSASVSLTANPVNGFASQVSVQVSGLPSGVSVSPTPITLVPGTALQLTLTAAASAATANVTVSFTGTSGALTHTGMLSLSVNSTTGALPTRTRYVRTDATTEYWGWVNQHWILYHAATGRYFVSDPSSNQVIVVDAATEKKIASIGVPGAFGMDDTPDHATLYVGTQIGDVYAIDPVAMTVTKRYISSQIGPYGYLASSALVLADGRLALIGPYNGIDGTGNIAVWNPPDNSITIYGSFENVGVAMPCGGNSFFTLGGFARSVDRTQIILGAINGGELCEFNPSTGTGNYTSAGSALHILTSPDGKYIILPSISNTGVTIYDAQTLATISEFDLTGGTGPSSGLAISADSKTLYVPAETITYAYDLATHQLVGWTPNMYIPSLAGGFVFGPLNSPYLLATDGSGLFAGPVEEGIGFVDLSVLQTGAVGTQFTNGYLTPATGPTTGGTATRWSDPNTLGTLKSIYFGGKQATSVSAGSGYINATSPSGTGPADVYAFTKDGGMQLLPEAFNYGPTVLQITPNMSTQEGGGTGVVFGYGLGPVTSSNIPSDLQIRVAGVLVRVTAFVPYAYPTSAPPFPLQAALFTIPPGTAGGPVDVTVSTANGSTTAKASLSYLPAVQQFPLPGSALAQGIYDAYRDQYYFTDAKKVQVFSRTQGKWLAPISIPGSQRLWGIALSPDGSKLAVSDPGTGDIYLLNAANTTSIKTFDVSHSQFGTLGYPCGLAVSDAGNIYYMVYVPGISGADQYFKLNTNNGTIFDYRMDSPGFGPQDIYLRNAISSDNSRVYFSDYGLVFSVDTATDQIFEALDGYGCCYGNYELALSSNQTQLTATFFIYDSDLNGQSYYALNDREILTIQYVYGAKMSPDGRLLFQPATSGIDVFDGRLGNLRNRIALPIELSPNYDALVGDGRDNVLLAITGQAGDGIAIVDLTSVVEPPPAHYAETRLSDYFHSAPGGQASHLFRLQAREGRNHSQPAIHPAAVPHVTRFPFSAGK